jgi:hypothetical protein
LVFWDTGSQVTLTMHMGAQSIKLQAIPGSPLNLVGIENEQCSRATVRYKVPLINICGRTILLMASSVSWPPEVPPVDWLRQVGR